MKHWEMKENEKFFDMVFSSLKEGGIYAWRSELEFYMKNGEHLVGNGIALDKVKKIVTEEYFIKRFRLG